MSKLPISSSSSTLVLPQKTASLAIRRTLRPTVLAYHELSPERTAYRYALSCLDFEEHLSLAAQLSSDAGDVNFPIVISFDDGHISNYSSALLLLEKYSCKAIFFVIAGRIGEHKDFMTWAHLKELVALGHQVEAHGWSHTFLTSCSDSELHNELERSREVLQERTGAPVTALSAPHGRWDRRVVRACAAAGYRQLYTSSPWSSRRTLSDVELIGRLIAVQSMDTTRLLRWLTMGRVEAGLHRAQHALKQSARFLLGNKLYYQLWARFSGWNGGDDALLNGGQ